MGASLVILYFPAIDSKLLSFDDPDYITHNYVIANGLDRINIVQAFTHRQWGLYIPVTSLSLMLDVELFGMAPRGFHMTNIVLHAIDMALLFLILWRMTGALGKSAAAAALVAFHPMRVESVVWVTERKDVLSLLFLLLSIASHLRFVRTGRWRWLGAVTAFFLLGLLSKPIVATLPLLLLLLDYWPLGRFRQTEDGRSPLNRFPGLALEKTPLFLLAGLLSLMTISFHQANRAIQDGITLTARIEHSLSSDFFYLYQTFFPADLAIRFWATPWQQFNGTLVPALAGAVLATAVILRYSGRVPALAAGSGWYLVALLPVSGVFGPLGSQWLSDRFTYIPHIGLAIAFVWAMAGLPASHRFRSLLQGAGVLLLGTLTLLSMHQMSYWKDGATLFRHGVVHSGNDPMYLALYATELLNSGDIATAKEQNDRLLPFATSPKSGGILIQQQCLAIMDRMGNRDGAIEQAQRFLQADSRFFLTRLWLANALLSAQRFQEAAPEYLQVLEVPDMKPSERANALEGLAVSLARLGRVDEAINRYREGLETDPSRASMHIGLARLLEAKGNTEEGGAHFKEALRLSPDDLGLRLDLAEFKARSGAVQAAVAMFEGIARTTEGKAEALLAKGRIFELAGMATQARPLYERALELTPILPDTDNVLRERLSPSPPRREL